MSTNNKATLRIYSDTLDVDQISSMVNVLPSRVIHKGDLISRQTERSKTHEDSICFYDTETSDPLGLDKCVRKLLTILEQSPEIRWDVSSQVKMDIICYLTVDPDRITNSFCFEHDLIERLSQFPIPLIVNCVPA
ncbi:DUF4279 domain-containing protein [Bremerella sp. JC770]|uniref:DUF4279 domain-containing protein n=1 Tax=Bremerella sp. JC770 TaxID=3232137 RepID=UPI00345962A8